ncbi:MAG: hypothetical protein AB200_00690 [Parcubacteria bacterium C7867-005]|nr:MAG: hypothetical protein AB200_00690 [Parcubacteria bacterium C7867-005]
MKKCLSILIFLLVLIVGCFFLIVSNDNMVSAPEENELSTTISSNVNPSGRIMFIDDYIKQNISELSPEKEVLGGKFYVTEISSGDGMGTVSYEDGHVSYTADFTYLTNENTGHTVTSFVLRK